MIRCKNILAILLACMIVFTGGSVLAAYVHDTCYDPPNVPVNSNHPYYFTLGLPSWDFNKDAYTAATFELTYLDQYYLDIFIYAADPTVPPAPDDPSNAADYNILIGTVPVTTPGASGTAQFDLLAGLSKNDFELLFKGEPTFYLVSKCDYVFDKACLHMEAVPIPATFLLFGSGLLGLIGLRRRIKK